MITQRCVRLLFRSVFSLSWFSAHRNPCVLLSAAFFFPTQQFDAALSGITFATPICTPSVTLLLPNLLPSSLLPPAGSGRKYIQLHIKFEPQPLPPAKNCTNINRLQALHLFGLFLLNLPYIDFFFIFSQLVNLWVFQHFFCCCCSAALALPRVAEAAL